MTKLCCNSLKLHVNDDKQDLQGFSIKLDKGKKLSFLRYRVFDSSGLSALENYTKSEKSIDFSLKIRVESEIGIKYCPWCGALLSEIMKAD